MSSDKEKSLPTLFAKPTIPACFIFVKNKLKLQQQLTLAQT